MRHTAYFLVEPTSDAQPQFVNALGGFASVLLETVLLSREFTDRSSWREAELTLAVKLLYLARLREYQPLSSDADAERALGSAAISAEVFDRWWSIRRIEFEGASEQMQGFLVRVMRNVPATGNATVDEWLQEMTSR
jgi:hypothetical protein